MTVKLTAGNGMSMRNLCDGAAGAQRSAQCNIDTPLFGRVLYSQAVTATAHILSVSLIRPCLLP